MYRHRFVFLLGWAAMLAGCDMQPDFNVRPDWTPMQAPKTNQVQAVHNDVVIPFPPGSARLGASEVDQLDRFLAGDGGNRSQVSVVIGTASGPPNLAELRGREIQSRLARHGIPATILRGESDRMAPNTVLVSIDRYVVTTPRCPDFSKSTESNYTNTPDSNFGCANAQNLGVMVADPADLTRGRDLGPQDGPQSVLAIQRYRVGKVTPLGGGGSTSSGGATSGGGSSGAN
jgi:pilus assembly protein CpaD